MSETPSQVRARTKKPSTTADRGPLVPDSADESGDGVDAHRAGARPASADAETGRAVMHPAARGSGVERARRGSFRRMFGAELALVFGRWRNRWLLLALTLAPIGLGVAIRASSGPDRGEGPPFLGMVAGNGLFLVFASLVVTLPVLLPLGVAVISGDAIAGEAGSGTLRYLLCVPVGRGRLLLVKWLAAMSWAGAATFLIALSGLITGGVLFGLHGPTLLSGDTVSLASGLVRAGEVSVFVLASLTGLVSVGLLLSVLTEVPIVAMSLTLGFLIVTEVLDAIPQIAAIHPYLLTDHWLAFGEFLRSGTSGSTLGAAALVQAGYILVAGSLAWARFTTTDVSA